MADETENKARKLLKLADTKAKLEKATKAPKAHGTRHCGECGKATTCPYAKKTAKKTAKKPAKWEL
jgi:hypothetical protein